MNKIDKSIYDNLELLPENLQGWNSENPIFGNLIKILRPKTIIEVGTWKGASAIHMAKQCKELGLKTVIYCVDTWLGSTEFWASMADTPERDLMLKNGYPQIYYQFLSNVVHQGLQDYLIPVPNTSANAARVLEHQGITAELIYLDASHEYDDVLTDIGAYCGLCTGLMFGDDYGWAGVGKAVRETLKFSLVDNNYWVAKFSGNYQQANKETSQNY